MIRTSLYGASVIVIEAIVGVGSPQRRKGKTVTKFDALYGGNGEHHMADLAFKGVEKGSPRPAARPRIWHSMIPPTESRSPLASKMAFLAASPFCGSKKEVLAGGEPEGFPDFLPKAGKACPERWQSVVYEHRW